MNWIYLIRGSGEEGGRLIVGDGGREGGIVIFFDFRSFLVYIKVNLCLFFVNVNFCFIVI